MWAPSGAVVPAHHAGGATHRLSAEVRPLLHERKGVESLHQHRPGPRSSSPRNQDPSVTPYPRSMVEGSTWSGSGGAESDDHLSWHRTTVSGRRAVYGVGGADGPPVVFLHGWALGSRAYKRAMRRLTSRGCRVIRPRLALIRRYGEPSVAPHEHQWVRRLGGVFHARSRNQGARSRDRPLVWWWRRHQAGPSPTNTCPISRIAQRDRERKCTTPLGMGRGIWPRILAGL